MENNLSFVIKNNYKLELAKLGFTNTVHKSEGHSPYDAAVLLKLYLYGYLNKILRSRKLERESIKKNPVPKVEQS